MIRPPSRLSRLVAPALAVMALAALTAAPVSATPDPDHGSSAKCRYAVTYFDNQGWTEAELYRLAVSPAVMLAKSGTQTVGWRFVVQRSLHREFGPWKVTHVSAVQRASATTSVPASFGVMRVDVAVPSADDTAQVWYRITIKMIWYNADGSVQSKSSFLLSHLDWIVRHSVYETDDFCPGGARQFHE